MLYNISMSPIDWFSRNMQNLSLLINTIRWCNNRFYIYNPFALTTLHFDKIRKRWERCWSWETQGHITPRKRYNSKKKVEWKKERKKEGKKEQLFFFAARNCARDCADWSMIEHDAVTTSHVSFNPIPWPDRSRARLDRTRDTSKFSLIDDHLQRISSYSIRSDRVEIVTQQAGPVWPARILRVRRFRCCIFLLRKSCSVPLV